LVPVLLHADGFRDLERELVDPADPAAEFPLKVFEIAYK
jgi:hypothetical protein